MATSIAALMNTLRSQDATRPRLTWYGPGGERVELSGKVLDNWVAKTANFLADELDAGPGTAVQLDLPAHWRSLCWSLAGWLAGATLRFGANGPGGLGADVVATDHPERPRLAQGTGASGSGITVAVALGALDMRWPGDLPDGTVDYAAEVRAHGDVFIPFAEPAGTGAAVEGTGSMVTFAELLAGYASPVEGAERVLLRAGALEPVIREALGIWAAGGSVVLVHPEVEVTDRLVQSEMVTINPA
jgi:uncharacterized protein (TIGR03089 family)